MATKISTSRNGKQRNGTVSGKRDVRSRASGRQITLAKNAHHGRTSKNTNPSAEDYDQKVQRRWEREARRAKKALISAIKLIDYYSKKAKRKSNKLAIACCDTGFGAGICTGHMALYSHDVKCPLWTGGECDCTVSCKVHVAAHAFPVFVQCDKCGHTPCEPVVQMIALGRLAANK